MVYEQKYDIAEGVKVEAGADGMVSISGEKGSVDRVFVHPHVKLSIGSDCVTASTESKRKMNKAVVGSWISHINNMAKGVTSGFVYNMKIVYTHFPMTASVNNGVVEIKNFLGAKGILKAKIVGDTGVKVGKEDVTVTGMDKEHVGQTAANIERACKVKGKDRRVFQDGIFFVSKE